MRKKIGMILGILMLAIAVLTGCGGSQGTSSSSAAKSATSSSAAQAGKDVTIKMLTSARVTPS